MQSYDFQKNDAYATGSQSSRRVRLHAQSVIEDQMWLLGWGGLTVLGAIDSLPLGLTEIPEEEEESPETRVRACPRGRAFTTTDLDRTLA